MKSKQRVKRSSITQASLTKKGQEGSLDGAKGGGRVAFPKESKSPSLHYGGSARVKGAR